MFLVDLDTGRQRLPPAISWPSVMAPVSNHPLHKNTFATSIRTIEATSPVTSPDHLTHVYTKPAPPLTNAGNKRPKAPKLKLRKPPTKHHSTHSTQDLNMSDADDKKRNKLGYQRISIACAHCRRRKIRCLVAEGDPHNRCQNCIRLKKECLFYPVDQQTVMDSRPEDKTKSSLDPSQSPSIPMSPTQGPLSGRIGVTTNGYSGYGDDPDGIPYGGIPITPISVSSAPGAYPHLDFGLPSHGTPTTPWSPTHEYRPGHPIPVASPIPLAPPYMGASVGQPYATFPVTLGPEQNGMSRNEPMAFGADGDRQQWPPARSLSYSGYAHEDPYDSQYSSGPQQQIGMFQPAPALHLPNASAYGQSGNYVLSPDARGLSVPSLPSLPSFPANGPWLQSGTTIPGREEDMRSLMSPQ